MLRDWSTGKFARYSIPPTTDLSNTCDPKTQHSIFEKLYASDAIILEHVLSRKELRKFVGLVKISSGEVDPRKVVLQDHWLKESNSERSNEEGEKVTGPDDDDNDSNDDSEEPVDEGQIEDDEVDEDGTNRVDEEEPLPLSKKQKRKRTNEPLVAPPSKKVAFAPEPKIVKQARKATTSKVTKKPANAKIRIQHKVANVGVKNKATIKSTDHGDAYDFGKFF